MANETRISIVISADGTAAISGIGRVTSSLDQVEDAGTRSMGKLKRETHSAAGAMPVLSRATMAVYASLTALLASAGGLAGISLGVLKVSSEFENFNVQLETILGSSDKAREALSWIEDFAAKTPFELSETIEAFILLQAVGMDARTALLGVGNTAASMNRSLMDTATAVISMEREVLKRYGIDFRQEADKATFIWQDRTGQMVSRTVQGGQQIQRETLLAIWNDRYAGGMERFQSTWTGMLSNLHDDWDKIMRKIGEAGVFDLLKGKLKAVLEYFEEAIRSGKAEEWARRISSAARDTWTVLETLGGIILKAIRILIDYKNIILAVAVALTFNYVAAAVLAAAKTTNLVTAINLLVAALRFLYVTALPALLSPLGLATVAVGGLAYIFLKARDNANEAAAANDAYVRSLAGMDKAKLVHEKAQLELDIAEAKKGRTSTTVAGQIYADYGQADRVKALQERLTKVKTQIEESKKAETAQSTSPTTPPKTPPGGGSSAEEEQQKLLELQRDIWIKDQAEKYAAAEALNKEYYEKILKDEEDAKEIRLKLRQEIDDVAKKQDAEALERLKTKSAAEWQHETELEVMRLQFLGKNEEALDYELERKRLYYQDDYNLAQEYAQKKAELYWQNAQVYLQFTQQMTELAIRYHMAEGEARSNIGKQMLATTVRFFAQQLQQFMFMKAKEHLVNALSNASQIQTTATRMVAETAMLAQMAAAYASFYTAQAANPYGGQAYYAAAALMSAATVMAATAMSTIASTGATSAAAEYAQAAAWAAGGIAVGAIGEAAAARIEGQGTPTAVATPTGGGGYSISPIGGNNEAAGGGGGPKYTIIVNGNFYGDRDQIARELVEHLDKANRNRNR